MRASHFIERLCDGLFLGGDERGRTGDLGQKILLRARPIVGIARLAAHEGCTEYRQAPRPDRESPCPTPAAPRSISALSIQS